MIRHLASCRVSLRLQRSLPSVRRHAASIERAAGIELITPRYASVCMMRTVAFILGAVLTPIGSIIFIGNVDATGPEAYEQLYWAAGGCGMTIFGVICTIFPFLPAQAAGEGEVGVELESD